MNEELSRALLVIVLDPKIRAWLKTNDPKALEQALRALAGASLSDEMMFAVKVIQGQRG